MHLKAEFVDKFFDKMEICWTEMNPNGCCLIFRINKAIVFLWKIKKVHEKGKEDSWLNFSINLEVDCIKNIGSLFYLFWNFNIHCSCVRYYYQQSIKISFIYKIAYYKL